MTLLIMLEVRDRFDKHKPHVEKSLLSVHHCMRLRMAVLRGCVHSKERESSEMVPGPKSSHADTPVLTTMQLGLLSCLVRKASTSLSAACLPHIKDNRKEVLCS